MCNEQKSNMIVLWWKFVMKSRDNPFNPDKYFFVIYVTVLCEPIFTPDALSSIIHIWPYVPVGFVHVFFFFNFSRICFRTKITLPYHLRYQKYSLKIQRGFKGLSWLIMCSGVACIQNKTIKGRLSFIQLFFKQLSLVNKLTYYQLNDIGCKC